MVAWVEDIKNGQIVKKADGNLPGTAYGSTDVPLRRKCRLRPVRVAMVTPTVTVLTAFGSEVRLTAWQSGAQWFTAESG